MLKSYDHYTILKRIEAGAFMYQKKLLSEKIVENIIGLIAKGYFKPGDKMPNELQLSQELNISRATLREAIKTLASRNVLEVRRGIGTFVSEVPGLAKDPLGSDFMCIDANPNAMLTTVQFQSYQAFTRLKVFSTGDVQALLRQYRLVSDDEVHAEKYFESIGKIAQSVSLRLDDQFSFRMLIVTYELLTDYLCKKALKSDSVLRELYEHWLTALEQRNIDGLKQRFNSMIEWIIEKGI